ncbi:hypothetical protein QP164_02660 [Sphingomonas sp. LR59]|uniref:type ISP restriction/modification enzyme n=1 Tax=Sphingomonas sp. LR59 TaxID=3050232 RepID=UPI002FE13002
MPNALDKITDFPSLVDYLRDELEWPIAADISLDEATYDVTPEEIGLKSSVVGGGIEIKQLRPLTRAQPWGIFFLNLPSAKLPVTLVRNILGKLAIKKRASANPSERAAFAKHDLLFIAATGPASERRLAFAHFANEDGDGDGDAATLKVLGWDTNDTPRRFGLTEASLKSKLHWPENPSDADHWRRQWSEAFAHADTRTVVRESKQMAKELAGLARRIRDRAGELIAAQTDNGSLVKLHKAFKEALIQDLTPEGFADTYAQTIAYGLLSAAISRASGALTQDDMAANVAGTSPFLKEMLGTFIEAGGRKSGKAQGLDFDELGITDVVELLRNADMEAVLADFDRKNPDEDPVIHFYELFLKEYDAAQKVKRGVFYTPRPVVGFIVRSVDAVLRTEFGLEDGLASTATWGDIITASKSKEGSPITLPEHAKEGDAFVRILDPATGTGTFIVECVDLIHKTMVKKWKAAGKRDAEIKELWNAYVPLHLLPRLTGFELMMAPYAIAHVKLGLKLSDTGYTFGSDVRAQIYLTNALEPAQLIPQFGFMSAALAHEAQAANKAKETPFTVVIGNPPYAGASANNSASAQALVAPYRSINGISLGERKMWVQNDYVKFFGLAETIAARANTGVLGFITDNSFTDGPTFRGLRHALQARYRTSWLVDLGGKSTALRDDSADANVFEDIQQGVAVIVGAMVGDGRVTYNHRLKGTLKEKYSISNNNTVTSLATCQGYPRHEFYDFFSAPLVSAEAEFDSYAKLNTIFTLTCTGVQTSRDELVVNFTKKELLQTVSAFYDPSISDKDARLSFFGPSKPDKMPAGDTRHWKVPHVRQWLRSSKDWKSTSTPISYRPFDNRFFYADERLSDWPRPELSSAMSKGDNVALIAVRRTENSGPYTYAFATDATLSNHSLSSKDGSYGMPLYLRSDGVTGSERTNITSAFAARVATLTGLTYDDCVGAPKQGALGGILPKIAEQVAMFAPARRERGKPGKSFGPRDLFDYIYSLLHSPAYRARYADYLKSDFARIPLPANRAVFEALVPLGTELVALHLLKAETLPVLEDPKGIRLAGSGEARIAFKPEYDSKLGRVTINTTRWIESVPEVAWNFQVGGYQPAQKWLKDRAARGARRPVKAAYSPTTTSFTTVA